MLENFEAILSLLTGLIGLISGGIGVYFAFKNLIVKIKAQSKTENWNLLMSIADSAMREAEKSTKKGADKKTMAMDIIKASCTTAGLDINQFIDQVDTYIDETIAFVNSMKEN
jgi:hypothetical protein